VARKTGKMTQQTSKRCINWKHR